MELAIIMIFSVVSFFVCLHGWKKRKKSENIFYMTALVLCSAVLILKGLNMWTFDPTKALAEFFYSHGLLQ